MKCLLNPLYRSISRGYKTHYAQFLDEIKNQGTGSVDLVFKS